MSDKRTLPNTVFALVLACVLSACDGGLFGTDDGGSVSLPVSSAPPATGIETPATMETESPPTSDVGAAAADSGTVNDSDTDSSVDGAGAAEPTAPGLADPPAFGSETPVAFDNTQITTTRNDALLTVVNPRDTEVLLLTDGLNEAQTSEVSIPAGSASQHLALPVGVTFVRLFDNSANDPDARPFSLNLNLGTGTVTTVIARDSNGQLNAIPLASESGSSDVMLAKIRLVQAAELGDPQRTADLMLASRGPGGGGVEAEIAGLSFDSPDSGYLEVPAGDYTLSDSAARFPAQNVSFEGGQTYTVIIRADVGNVLQVEVDSNLDVR